MGLGITLFQAIHDFSRKSITISRLDACPALRVASPSALRKTDTRTRGKAASHQITTDQIRHGSE